MCCLLLQCLLEDLKGLEIEPIMVLGAIGQAQEGRKRQQNMNISNLTVLQVGNLMPKYRTLK
jgi:hypothetical protein